ncbi:hypothetical protein MMC34_002544 [Xylographa carneopallida]|nr:hypothetical protein [Xylographa carneopallida]
MNTTCQCRATTFRTPLPAPLAVYICHCLECQRQSASAFGISARFPRFVLPAAAPLSCYTRPTASGGAVHCYFCSKCGSRLVHDNADRELVSVKGGCIEGLDLSGAVHIWCKRAVVPVPEGVVRWEGEPGVV